MEIKIIADDIHVFGHVVPDFPSGVAAAFDAMVRKLPGGFDRDFYGISAMRDGKMQYVAAAAARKPDEGEIFGYQHFAIEKGEYLAIPLENWREKTQCINDTFHTLTEDPTADLAKPCVEWYVNDETMWCLVKKK